MLLILAFSFLISASAEYRAYELALVDVEAGTEVKIISTLDHIQYRGYHPVSLTQQVMYVDSWMCRGNTKNFKPICPNPKSTERTPASASTPTSDVSDPSSP